VIEEGGRSAAFERCVSPRPEVNAVQRREFLAALSALALGAGRAHAQGPVPASGAGRPADALRARLEAGRQVAGLDASARQALTEVYAQRGFEPAFVEGGRWSSLGRGVILKLADAREHGLDPQAYARAVFARGDEAFIEADAAATAELDLAASVVTYARHAVRGRTDLRRLSGFVESTLVNPDLPRAFGNLFAAREAGPALEALHPRHPGYLALKRALAAVSAPPSSSSPHPRIPEGRPIRLGQADPRVPMLRERFQLAAPAGDADVVDLALVAAIRDAQRANRLRMTGVVDTATLRALNGDPPVEQSRERRIADILVNMERWRFLPRELGERHVWVNVPEALIRVVENGREAFATRAVVGKAETPTPMFSNEMQYFVVNPSWNVPPGMIEREYGPLLERNPWELARRGIEVTYGRDGQPRFRQPPGERNALGRIKFMFPNAHAIYLHDTPQRSFFARDRRFLSNGCVRVQDPLRFAEVAFAREGDVTARRIQSLYGSEERHVRLRHRVPVHLAYFTLAADPEGRLSTFPDPYNLDRRMREMLGLA
jgi:murein L,D-transpeptidase YcbB/YkuD